MTIAQMKLVVGLSVTNFIFHQKIMKAFGSLYSLTSGKKRVAKIYYFDVKYKTGQ